MSEFVHPPRCISIVKEIFVLFKCLLRSILAWTVLRKQSQRQRRSRRRELLTGSEKDVTITAEDIFFRFSQERRQHLVTLA